MQLMVTGGAGFIGSNLVRYLISNTKHDVVNIDSLTYAGNLESLSSVHNSSRYRFEHADINDFEALSNLFKSYQPDIVFHLAAESHVDRSIDNPELFLKTNILGTFNLLEISREYIQNLRDKKLDNFRFIHVSTDEVYGDLDEEDQPFTELSSYNPSSPYAASKASSDHLVKAWSRTYEFPSIITNCSNNFGPYQFPEKLIPLIILNAINHSPLPIYGNGEQIRDWLYVEDHVEALYKISQEGKIGDFYNIGASNEIRNIEIVRTICKILDDLVPHSSPYSDLITFVEDRPGHDLRYAINPEKINLDIDWYASTSFDDGLKETINWYLDNRQWCENIQDGSYRKRLGLGSDKN